MDTHSQATTRISSVLWNSAQAWQQHDMKTHIDNSLLSFLDEAYMFCYVSGVHLYLVGR